MTITVTHITWEIMHNNLSITPCKYLLSGMSCVCNISNFEFVICDFIRSNKDEHLFDERVGTYLRSHLLLIHKAYWQLFQYRDTIK